VYLYLYLSVSVSGTVEVLVPALPTDNFVKLAKPKRNIKAKHFKDHITSNIVEKRTCNNIKGLELSDYKKQCCVSVSVSVCICIWYVVEPNYGFYTTGRESADGGLYRRWFLRAVLNASKEFACTTLFGRWFQWITVSTKKECWYCCWIERPSESKSPIE
jgi:hypothetical protein